MKQFKAHYLHDFIESHETVKAPNKTQAEKYFKQLAKERDWRLVKFYEE